MILDGRNRWKACVELGIAPATRDFNGNPWTYAWSLNGQRRDLTEIQRGAIKLLCDRGNADYLAKQAETAARIQQAANKARSEAAKERPFVGNQHAKPEVVVGVPKEHTLPDKPYQDRPGRSSRAAAAGVSPSVQAKVEAIANHSEDMLRLLAYEVERGPWSYESPIPRLVSS